MDDGLPNGLALRGKSPEFTETSIPANLRREHRTHAETWARIVVLEGRLCCRVLEPVVRQTEVAPGRPAVVEPGVPHSVEPVGRVRFLIEFYR